MSTVTGRRGLLMKQKWPAGFAVFFWNGSVAAEVGSKDAAVQCRTNDGFCRAGTWHHVAVAVEAGRKAVLYVDGEAVKTAALKHAAQATDAPLLIGWNGWGGKQNDPSPGPFAGLLDELTVWDRALSADELLAEMAGKR